MGRLHEHFMTALLCPLCLYLHDSNTAWHFGWCIIQWGTNYPGSWYKEISSLPYCCSSSSYFVNREFPAAGQSNTHCKVNCIPVNCLVFERKRSWIAFRIIRMNTVTSEKNLHVRHWWLEYSWRSPPTKCDQNKRYAVVAAQFLWVYARLIFYCSLDIEDDMNADHTEHGQSLHRPVEDGRSKCF